MQLKPQIIWVVGDNTNVGKTSISTALIRQLNAVNNKAIGFKPYAGGRLIDIVDLLEEIAVNDQLLVGRDACKLAKASPLTPTHFQELINPSWRITYPSRDDCMFIRKGSSQIGQRHFYHTKNTAGFLDRDDFKELNKKILLPVKGIRTLENLPADSIDALEQSVQKESYLQLLALRPDSIVCEGAGRLLPYWETAPPVRHIFLVSKGNLYLFPRVNLDFSQKTDPRIRSVPTIAAIMGDLKGRRHMRGAIPVLGTANFDDGMDRFVKPFLMACLD